MDIEKARAVKEALLQEFDVQATDQTAERVLSRFEEGQPADPTENMSPEDAKKWREEHENNKDRFKEAKSNLWYGYVRDKQGFAIRMIGPASKSKVEKDLRAEAGDLDTEWFSVDEAMTDFRSDLQDGISASQFKKLPADDKKRLSKLMAQYEDQKKKTASLAERTAARFVEARTQDAATFMRLRPGMKVKVESPGIRKPRVLDVQNKPEKLASGNWIVPVSSGRPWGSGRIKGGILQYSEEPIYGREKDEIAYQPTLMQSPVVVSNLEIVSEAEAERLLQAAEADMTPEERVLMRFEAAKTAGFSYGSAPMSVLFVESKKPVPFNVDTIQDINHATIPIIGDDGEEHDVNLKFVRQESSGPLTHGQEKQGWKREVKVDITHPVDEGGSAASSARAAMAALVQVGKKHGFKVEPVKAGYKPQTRKASIVEAKEEMPEAPDAEAGWQPGQKRNEWNLSLYKYSASRWSYFLTNPSGGGSGSSSYPTLKAALAAGTRNVAWGEPSVNPGKKKVWVMEQTWDPEAEAYAVKKSYWWDIPDDLLQKKFR